MSYSNSTLVDCKVMSPNHSGTRTHEIDTIIPHCVVGQLSAESIGGCFTNPSREASCNYGIGKDGRVCLIVDEANRSWCTSNREIDQRGITIECASDKTEPYTMNDKVYNKLIDLCVDICKRNGKTKLLWFADKEKTLKYKRAKDEMVLAVHRWFANKSCPGDWLYSRLDEVAAEVTKRLGAATPEVKKYYRVRKAWNDAESQLGAYEVLENAKNNCPEGYTVYDWNGKAVYTKGAVKVKMETLKKGSTGNQVTIFETLMKEMGLYTGAIDTEFGNGCLKACNKFQEMYPECGTDGKPDNTWGKKCWNKVFSIFGA